MFPAGGVPTGHQIAMRSKSPFGPYEAKKVLAQGKSKSMALIRADGFIQNTAKTGSCISRTRKPTDVWFTCSLSPGRTTGL